MKSLKILFSTAVLVLFLSAFTNEAKAQHVEYYKNDANGQRYKVEFTANGQNERIWIKKSDIDSWAPREVYYSDEELIKYKNQGHDFVLKFNSDITRFEVISPSQGNKSFGTYHIMD